MLAPLGVKCLPSRWDIELLTEFVSPTTSSTNIELLTEFPAAEFLTAKLHATNYKVHRTFAALRGVLYRGSIDTMKKILTIEEMILERRRLRREGKRLVLTNGCFDLLHPGHVRYLSQARALGDALVVALNSDRSVRALKGEGRPILDQEDRAEVIAALECVDYVTIFDEETPRELIAAVLPDVLVKGGDWALDEIIGREEVEAAGGQVRSLPYVEGSSTTDIVERIKKLPS